MNAIQQRAWEVERNTAAATTIRSDLDVRAKWDRSPARAEIVVDYCRKVDGRLLTTPRFKVGDLVVLPESYNHLGERCPVFTGRVESITILRWIHAPHTRIGVRGLDGRGYRESRQDIWKLA